ncbi:MAG: hypothetical protein MJE66_11350 [Proteobacteria bacterium]|nr:hypothetical protein [Pseudomonadota bacterium]
MSPPATLFDRIADELERGTSLSQLAARGTLRIALKEAGIDPRRVTAAQLDVVLAKVMPRELESRGVDDPSRVCGALRRALAAMPSEADPADTPEAVFARLGGS